MGIKLVQKEIEIAKDLLSTYKDFARKQDEEWNGRTQFHGVSHIHEFMQYPCEKSATWLCDVNENADRYYEGALDDIRKMTILANLLQDLISDNMDI